MDYEYAPAFQVTTPTYEDLYGERNSDLYTSPKLSSSDEEEISKDDSSMEDNDYVPSTYPEERELRCNKCNSRKPWLMTSYGKDDNFWECRKCTNWFRISPCINCGTASLNLTDTSRIEETPCDNCLNKQD